MEATEMKIRISRKMLLNKKIIYIRQACKLYNINDWVRKIQLNEHIDLLTNESR